MDMTDIPKDQQTEFEAAAFRRLLAHLNSRTDVQNIDMMTLAGFCRNCLANWYRDAANDAGVPIGKEEAREHVYGMPYDDWRRLHQTEAAPESLAAFETSKPDHA